MENEIQRIEREQASLKVEQAALASQVQRAERMLGQIKFAHRHMLLCSAIVYLAGIVLSVVIAKMWWRL